nr:MAG TPA: hypothetical protein [Caudoviricetes sp.]
MRNKNDYRLSTIDYKTSSRFRDYKNSFPDSLSTHVIFTSQFRASAISSSS